MGHYTSKILPLSFTRFVSVAAENHIIGQVRSSTHIYIPDFVFRTTSIGQLPDCSTACTGCGAKYKEMGLVETNTEVPRGGVRYVRKNEPERQRE